MEYVTKEIDVMTHSDFGGEVQYEVIQVEMCYECGSMVLDTQKHDRWHTLMMLMPL